MGSRISEQRKKINVLSLRELYGIFSVLDFREKNLATNKFG